MVPPQWGGEETVGVQLLLWDHPRVLSCRLHPAASHWWELDLPWISWELPTLPAVEPRLFPSIVIRETECPSSRGLSWPLVWNLWRETREHPVRCGSNVRNRHWLHVWNLEGAAWNYWYGRWHHGAGLQSGESRIDIRDIGNGRSGCARWR